MGTMWDKLLINVATGALAGITRLPYGGLYAVPEVKACALAAVAEGMAVAAAAGVKISYDRPRGTVDQGGRRAAPRVQDVDAAEPREGQPTEIDFINGSVVRWGDACGVPTPVNQALVACVKGIERRMQAATRPGRAPSRDHRSDGTA